jgi:hypothetical protein
MNRALSEPQRLDSLPTVAIERLAANDCRQATAPPAGFPGAFAALPHHASSNLRLLYEGVRRPAPRV